MAITSCARANVAQVVANVGRSLPSLGKLIGILTPRHASTLRNQIGRRANLGSLTAMSRWSKSM